MTGLIGHYFLAATGAPSSAPELIGEWGFYQNDANGDLYQWSPETAAWSLLGLSPADFPKRARLWHDQALYTTGTKFLNYDAAQNYSTYTYSSTHANGDTFTQSFVLDAGTYTLTALGVTSTDRGKLDWYIDNVLQGAGGQDWYASPPVYNTLKTLSVTVATAGYHVLKAIVNGKNASSSNYYLSLTKYWLTPSAD